jgi:hypothetical protein
MRSALVVLTLVVSLVAGSPAWSKPGPAAQAVTAEDQRALAITIYNGNLGDLAPEPQEGRCPRDRDRTDAGSVNAPPREG